jgi:hypothetical protein
MAFTESNTTLTREIATLTATLQRERQRRAAIASHAKEIEQRCSSAEFKLKQIQYANKKLEEELSQYKENEAENRFVCYHSLINHLYIFNYYFFSPTTSILLTNLSSFISERTRKKTPS